jgi:hypothetical protein
MMIAIVTEMAFTILLYTSPDSGAKSDEMDIWVMVEFQTQYLLGLQS